MRELDCCDFCEEPADGVYEVVPASAPGGQRRLVLCAACRDTLAGVVDPLLGALGGEPSERSTESSPAVTLEPAAGEGASDGDGTSDDGASDADGGDEDAEDPEAADGDDSVDDGDDRADARDDVTAEADVTDADEGDGAGERVEEDDEGDAGPDRPEGYAQLVRLLRNRPGAMTRADLAELADGAYDLSRAEVDAAVDAAVENGHLEETARGVRTP